MLEFLDFSFSGDNFYRGDTSVPLNMKGLTLLRGKNYDASKDGKATSNGACKTRLAQVLEGMIYGKSPRGNFKRTTLPEFTGTLKFKDRKGDLWEFSYTPSKSKDAWVVLKNDQKIKVSHKTSDCQEKLQKTLELSRDDFNYFVFINQRSLDVLIKGKPSEKKTYLEGFFNIDSFYAKSFELYNYKWKSIKDSLELLKNDRIRLDSVKGAINELAGEKWLILQIENCDDALELIKINITEKTEQQSQVQKHLEVWNQYHTLFTQLQELDVTSLKEEQTLLFKTKVELEQKEENRIKLSQFLKTKITPHQKIKPDIKTALPSQQKPNNDDIVSKEVAINQMKEKLQLKKQIVPLEQKLEELSIQLKDSPTTEELDVKKAELYKERKDAESHYQLLQEGGDACPTCKQPLTFILGDMTLDERKTAIKEKIDSTLDQEKNLLQLMSVHKIFNKYSHQLLVLKEQFSRYPVFGVKLSVAETELHALKVLASNWLRYEREQESLQKWQTTQDLLMVEATNLGYPEVLKDDFSAELKNIENKLFGLGQNLKLFDRFESLTEKVLTLPTSVELERQDKECREDLGILFSRVESLNEYKGLLKSQLANLTSLKKQLVQLEEKVATQEATESECKILELMNKFYSPTGFKVYELKQRSQKLIDRANIWSKLFFQEPYEWSLSEDLENLDILIRPTHDSETEPYPIALLSAGEFNRASRVLLFSQLELIPPNKKTNLLILDEIEGNLDEAGLTAFTEVVLPKLKETFPEYTIVVISHQTSLHNSGVLDHMWLVERRNRIASLSVFPDFHRSWGHS